MPNKKIYINIGKSGTYTCDFEILYVFMLFDAKSVDGWSAPARGALGFNIGNITVEDYTNIGVEGSSATVKIKKSEDNKTIEFSVTSSSSLNYKAYNLLLFFIG